MALILWLPLIDGIENQGLADLPTPSYKSLTENANGKIGKCYYGAGLIYHLSDPNIIQSKWTLALWVKNTAWNQNNDILLCKNNADATNCQFYFSVQGGTQLNFGIYGNSTSGGTYKYTFEADTWYHLAATFDGTNYKMYINGEKVKEGTCSNAMINNCVNLGIGNRSSNAGGTAQTGGTGTKYMNDVRIYDSVISDKEIQVLSRGLIIHYQLDRDGFGQDNIIPSSSAQERQYTYPASSCSDKYSVTTKIVPSASQYTLSFYAKSTVNGDKIRTHYYSPNTTTTCVSSQGITKTASDGNMDFTLTTDWELYWVTYSQNETTAVKHVICPRLHSGHGTGTVSVKMVKLEQGDKATPWIPNSTDALYTNIGLDENIIYDSSGYKHNGISNNITYDTETPRYNVSSAFNGTNSYIKINDNTWMSQGATELTVNEWAYATDWTAQTNPRLFSCTESGGFNTEGASSGYIRFSVHTYSDAEKTQTAYRYSNTFIKLADLESGWHMFTFIYTLTGTSVYIDGELYNTYNYATYGIHYNLNARLFLGCEANRANPSGPYFNSKLSDFRLYVTALSPEAIMELYHTGASLANNGTLMTNQFVEV